MLRLKCFSFLLPAIALALSLTACGGGTPEGEEAGAADSGAMSAASPSANYEEGTFNADHYGAYADESYAQRGEGYDWVGVEVKPYTDARVRVSVRSRGDKKDPTCTLHVLAMVQDANTLQVYDGQTGIVFSFSGDNLTIAPTEGQSADGLAYYCSGGATIAGQYTKVGSALDASQVDPRAFSQTLMYDDKMFFVEAKDGQLTVTPRGITREDPMVVDFEGEVISAEISDITGDNQPEVGVYTDNNGKGYAHVFTVLGGNSMVPVYLPDLSGNPEASQGYQGGDEFAMVENSLVRTFPIAGGKTRQIQYKVQAGENMPQLTIDRTTEY